MTIKIKHTSRTAATGRADAPPDASPDVEQSTAAPEGVVIDALLDARAIVQRRLLELLEKPHDSCYPDWSSTVGGWCEKFLALDAKIDRQRYLREGPPQALAWSKARQTFVPHDEVLAEDPSHRCSDCRDEELSF